MEAAVFLLKMNHRSYVESCHSVSGEERATGHHYTHAKRIGTDGQEGPSITEAVLGASIDVHVGTLPLRRPSPVCKARVDRRRLLD